MENHPNSEANEKLLPNWLELPREVILSILDKLNPFDILGNVRLVCTQWKSICKDPSLWRTIDFTDCLARARIFVTKEDLITQSLLMEREHKSDAEETSYPNRLEFDVTTLTTQLWQFNFAENPQRVSTQTPLMEKDPDSEAASEKLSPNWLELPREVTLSILDKLDAFDILENVRWVCTQWESICKDPSLWRTIVLRDDEFDSSWYLDRMCEQAVDLSCGGLIDLNLTDVGSDQLLYYVTQRCTQIRRLRLVRGDISDAGLCEAANKLPLLEDLEISYCDGVTEKALHMFGKSCPILKSLKMNRQGEECLQKNDTEAIEISENMPELRHLQLFGNRLTNNGLKAILDSCSHLEFLDLRQCFNINLNSSLGKICAERIKDFRAPYDSTNDYEYDATLYEDEYDDYPISSRDAIGGCDYGSD